MTTLLRSERARRGLRASDLAREIGVHPMSILRWERRERLPGPVHIHALARVLELEPARIAGFFDDVREAAPSAAPAGHRGHGLRPLRLRAGVAVTTIAAALDVPASTVYNWEAGRVRIPEVRLPGLAAILGLTPAGLAAGLASPVLVNHRPDAPPSPLRRLRHRSRLSQSRVAALAGIDRRSLGAWERGEAEPPLAALRRLGRVYGVPVSAVARAAGVTPPRLLDRRQWQPGDLPAVLRTLRQWTGLTQGELAARCGCSVAAVRGWEAGRAEPGARLLAGLERALSLPSGALDATRSGSAQRAENTHAMRDR
ncbi:MULTISPECIES: helix-turn-helix transcriptional regulator [unclassified Nocardioides]|uniref:helix-turn-helix transcriptional regulator n=1 Tax=unclassified Nocardioides TaxID=2615069 RepID=UPI0006FB9A3E|nr:MULTISPECIES: helix-turn-helix transcriptional regulator [unclassified Nocardioides]KRA38819.1 hypothetical protein ASD81_09555 [Nocardioides sp. Root614]KRA92779.1 hypothetical protein ASD84_09820 [Nocardioides sp. Root682]